MKNQVIKNIATVLAGLLFAATVNCQLSETFSDGDFTANPAWQGSNNADWIVNTSQQLQSNNTVANSSFYLSTGNTLAKSAQWEFYSQLTFSTSGANYVDVYLTASAANVLQATTTGYFVRLGNTADEISLYRKDANGSSTKIIDGADGRIAGSNNTMKIRVIRDASNKWTLYSDMTGAGTNFLTEGSVTDATFTTSAFFGILVKQSTASFFQKHFFDNITISSYVPDTTPPAVVSATATDANTVELVFSEAVDNTTASNINNYNVNSLGKPATATVDALNPLLVRLSFATSFLSGVNYTVTVNGVKDLAGNAISNGTANFSWFVIGMYSVVIDEIMADPTPQVGLPNAEWIELKNTTPVPVNLQGYKIGKAASISGAMPSYVLQPDSFVIVTTSSQVAALSVFGRTISVTSFPSLGNEGDYIFLQTNAGDVMHFVNYDASWYQNLVKADGGFSLEMMDTKNPCAGASNWKASNSSTGGTPGIKNSVDAVNKDTDAPDLKRAFAESELAITVYFNEPLDASTANVAANYTVSDGIGKPVSAIVDANTFTKVRLVLSTPLQAAKVYTVTVNGIGDCSGNIFQSGSARLGLASAADSLDLVVNELLFNPNPTSVDFIELYNRSNKMIDLSGISLASRSSTTGNIGTPVKVSQENYLFFPGEFLALTTEPATIARDYTIKFPESVQTMELPSFSDTKGAAIILNNQGAIVDELDYDAKWHFALLDNDEGVSLERIDYSKPTNDPANWTSAASTAGFATPGYENSQLRANVTPQGEIALNPKMFSPDNDGFEDFTLVEFKFPEPGYVANITIYDAAGRPVKVLQRNTTCAARGSFRWDGLDDKLQKVPVGTYIINTDIFNLKGQKKQFKNTVIVAKKM